ncbi:MAG: zinc ribbon domain-containing protein [Gammaproteobacteria bacterium]|nr:zinc ribbon domain-containing protein [Gammaproteobacteria bacterium]MDD9963477.1 zinc ribbon domain-containing protein [Gammaproteobacteria bacterium]MDE0273837.1 zinc ribbon domain-containing protein [Gammaproteobacteria bacterium]
MSSQELIVPDWLVQHDDQRLTLNGQRCADCGTSAFPRTASCPSCCSRELQDLSLGPNAHLFSITVDRVGFPLGHPFLVGQARFEEGAVVQGFVIGDVDNPPAIGSPLELVPFGVPHPGTKELLTTYGFRPVEVNDA